MKRLPLLQLLLLGLLAALAACDYDHLVEVDFAEPFPVGASNLPGFAFRDQGCYSAEDGRPDTLLVQAQYVLRSIRRSYVADGHTLDTVGLPRQAGAFQARGERFWVRPLAADSFQVSWPETDTLLTLQTGQLRHYRGWYYLHTPALLNESHWNVQRFAIDGQHLRWQTLQQDTLRLQALKGGALQVERNLHQTFYTLRPQSKRAVRQVHQSAELWTKSVEYRRKF